MTIAETRREGMVQLDVEGRVDTNTSPELQKKILQAFDPEPGGGGLCLQLGAAGASDRTEDSQLQGRLHEADQCAGFRAESVRHDRILPDADH